MKIFSKVILSLSLSAQVFAAPLEERQGTGNVTTIDAAVSRLLSRVLTEVYSINTALTTLGMPNLLGMMTAVQNDLASLTTNLGSVSSIISGGTSMTGCTLQPLDIALLLTNLATAQSIVSSLQTTLTTAASTLGSGDISAISFTIAALETEINTLNFNLQSYASSLLPCVSQFAPALLTPVQNALGSLSTSVQGILSQLGVGGVLNDLITTIIP